MIAAVDHGQKAVWGWGNTQQEAHDHSLSERAEKKTGVTWNKLEYSELRPDADLEHGGLEAYRYIIHKGSTEAQPDLFAG